MKLVDILNKFSDFRLLTNFNIDDLNVSLVTVSDAPDATSYSRGNEFILTTGYIFKDDMELLKNMLKVGKEGKCTAIGIKLSRFIKEIPSEILDYANEIKFPIIDIPQHYSYSDIINPILSNILSIQLEEMKFTENLYNNFMNMLVENKPIEDIFKYLFSIIRKSFTFEDYFLNKNYKYGNKIKNKKPYEHIIYGNGINLGKLICEIDIENATHIEKMAIHYCLAIINIKLNRNILIAKTKEQYLNDFIFDIANQNIHSVEELKTRAKLLKKDVDGKWICVIFDIDNYKNSIINYPDFNQNLEQLKGNMFKKIISFIDYQNLTFHYFTKSDSINVLIKVNENFEIEDFKEKFLNPIKKSLKENFLDNNLTFTIGIGSLQEHIIKSNISYKEAMDSIKIGKILGKKDTVIYFKEIEFFKNLKDVIDLEDEEPHFVKDLQKIIKYSEENNNDYIETFKILVENNWSINKTAEIQFLHYNTVKYRYEKLEQITGKNFGSSTDRFLLELSLKYLKLKENL